MPLSWLSHGYCLRCSYTEGGSLLLGLQGAYFLHISEGRNLQGFQTHRTLRICMLGQTEIHWVSEGCEFNWDNQIRILGCYCTRTWGRHGLAVSDTLPPPTPCHVSGSCGKVLSGCKNMLYNQNKEGVGEVCMWGRHVFMGYLNKEEATLEALDENGWLHSGDIGRLDSHDFLYITGRIKGARLIWGKGYWVCWGSWQGMSGCQVLGAPEREAFPIHQGPFQSSYSSGLGDRQVALGLCPGVRLQSICQLCQGEERLEGPGEIRSEKLQRGREHEDSPVTSALGRLRQEHCGLGVSWAA